MIDGTECVRHLDLNGGCIYHTLRDDEGCYVGTYSDPNNLSKAIKELGGVAWTVDSWSVLHKDRMFGTEDIW